MDNYVSLTDDIRDESASLKAQIDSFTSVSPFRMTLYIIIYMHVHVHIMYLYMLGVLCCFALFVCLILLASLFLPSHLSFKNMYMYYCTCN